MKCVLTIIFVLFAMLSCDFGNNNVKEVSSAEQMQVDSAGLSKTSAVLQTIHGNIRIKFYPQKAPTTVTRIIALINEGFYNGLTFHRVEPNYVIQTGDPTGSGMGGTGKKLPAEFNDIPHIKGTVAMARTLDPNSADSQFYITLSKQEHLDNQYTVFGQVIDGLDVLNKIRKDDKIINFVITD